MKVVVLANGALGSTVAARGACDGAQRIIAADGGAHHAARLDLALDLLIGDLDSVTDEEARAFASRGVPIERHPVHKDETDLELALRRAVDMGAREIVVLGALGARWDQTLANLLLPADQVFEGISVRYVDGLQSVDFVHAGTALELDARPCETVSLIPLTEEVTGITTTGLAWELSNATLRLGTPRGVSNRVVSAPSKVRVGAGVLAVVILREASASSR